MIIRRSSSRRALALFIAAVAALVVCLLLVAPWRTGTGRSPITVGVPAFDAGVRAFDAAKTQIGVPYVWGGDAPGKGFDDAALVQWAWAQAGVHIPPTSSQQFVTLPEVPLNRLQPGDLLFYYNLGGDGQVDHTVMYGGRGRWGNQTTIAAEHTGTTIGLQPEFTYGLVGAGSPFGNVRRPSQCSRRLTAVCFQRLPAAGFPGRVFITGGGDVGP